MEETVAAAEAARVVSALGRLAAKAREIAEAEPDLAALCDLEMCALEVRTILSGGAVERIARAFDRVDRGLGLGEVRREDLFEVTRLEDLVALGSRRIGERTAELAKGRPTILGTVGPFVAGAVVDKAAGFLRSLLGGR